MASRLVILHHVLPDGEHWDLMMECGDVLMTWQLLREPAGPASLPLPARRIGDHRKAYLTYEGPISGNRGFVRRIDGGTFEFVERSDTRVVVDINARRLSGRFSLAAQGDLWLMAVEA